MYATDGQTDGQKTAPSRIINSDYNITGDGEHLVSNNVLTKVTLSRQRHCRGTVNSLAVIRSFTPAGVGQIMRIER